MVKMSSGENIIAYVETVTGKPHQLKFSFPMVLLLDESDRGGEYKVRYRSWLMFSNDKTSCEVDRKQVISMTEPTTEIAYEYDDIVDEAEAKLGITDDFTEEDELLMDISDHCYEVDMEKVLNSRWGDPKQQNRGEVTEGISPPTPTEIRNVVDFLISCGIITEMEFDEDTNMRDDHHNYQDPGDKDDDWGHDPGDEHDSSPNTMKKRKWNPHDRWTE